MEQILANPILLIAVVVIAFVVGKLFKLAKKIIGIVICLVIAFYLVNLFVNGGF